MTAPAAVSWMARAGWLDPGVTALEFLGYAFTPWIFTVLALGELVTDQLPTHAEPDGAGPVRHAHPQRRSVGRRHRRTPGHAGRGPHHRRRRRGDRHAGRPRRSRAARCGIRHAIAPRRLSRTPSRSAARSSSRWRCHDDRSTRSSSAPARPVRSLAGRLTQAGMTVAFIERHLFGGTCVNTGCMPTKTLVASAYAAHLARRAADYGVVTRRPASDRHAEGEGARRCGVGQRHGPASSAGCAACPGAR